MKSSRSLLVYIVPVALLVLLLAAAMIMQPTPVTKETSSTIHLPLAAENGA
jgi:hypothetical protein